MKTIMNVMLMCALCPYLVGGYALAQDAAEVLAKIDMKTYYPQQHGLKDLAVSVEVQTDQKGKFPSRLAFQFYWALPDRSVVEPREIEIPPGLSEVEILEIAEYIHSMEEAIRLDVGEMLVGGPGSLTERVTGKKLSARKEGELTMVLVEESAGAPDEQLKTALWVDSDYRVVRKEMRFGNYAAVLYSGMEYEEHEGGYLLLKVAKRTEVERGQIKSQSRLSIGYVEVEGIFLVERLERHDLLEMKTTSMRFVGHRVNQGLSDDIFETAAVVVSGFVRRMDDARYIPARSGLKDVSFSLRASDFVSDSRAEGVVCNLIWKAPDRRKIEVIGGTNGAWLSAVKEKLRKEAEEVGDALVGTGFAQSFEGYRVRLQSYGPITKVDAERREDASETTPALRRLIWVDSRGLPIKQVELYPGETVIRSDFEYLQKGSQFMVKSCRVERDMGPRGQIAVLVEREYTAFEGIEIISAISISVPGTDEKTSVYLHNIRVNQGVPDEVFE